MDTLTKLFGSAAKVKIIKLFVFNPGVSYDAAQIAERVKESISKTRRELHLLDKMGLIRRKTFSKDVVRKKGRKKVARKVRTSGFTLNESFAHLAAFQLFLSSMNHITPKDVARKLQRSGSLKLIVVSGIFIRNPESRVDLLVVGDGLKKAALENAIKALEAEIGKEIRYALFETVDFKYRLGLYDKLIRDILDFPHETVVNRIGAL